MPEMVAASAAEPDRAGASAGLDVSRLGAGPVGDGDRADGVMSVLAIQQGAGVSPDPVTVPVELHRGHLVDGFAAAGLANPLWRRRILELSECLIFMAWFGG